jgi:hypothetical protein
MEIKLTGKPLAQRVADRLKGSAGDNSGADVTTHHGSGPTRTITSIHHGSTQSKPMNKRNDQDEGRR